MPQCCVPCCFNRTELKKTSDIQLSFYRFPANEKVKKKWLESIRRENYTPNCNSRVCSWHFPNGKAAGPSRFAWTEGKTFQFLDHLSLFPKGRKEIVANRVLTPPEVKEARIRPIGETSRDAVSPHVQNQRELEEFEKLKEMDVDREFLHPASPGFEIKKETHYEVEYIIPPENPPVSDNLPVINVNVSQSHGAETVSPPPTQSAGRSDLEMAVLRRQERVLQLQEEYYSLMIKYLKDNMTRNSGPGDRREHWL